MPWPKAPWGRKHVWFIYPESQSIEGSQGRSPTWRQGLMRRPHRGAAIWLGNPGLISLPFQKTQDHKPRGYTTHSGLSPHQLLISTLQTDLPTAWSYGVICSIEGSSTKTTRAYIKFRSLPSSSPWTPLLCGSFYRQECDLGEHWPVVIKSDKWGFRMQEEPENIKFNLPSISH